MYYVLLLKDLSQGDRLLVQQGVDVADRQGVVLPEHGGDRGLLQGPGLQQRPKVSYVKVVKQATAKPDQSVATNRTGLGALKGCSLLAPIAEQVARDQRCKKYTSTEKSISV